jgi:hypothetical protein
MVLLAWGIAIERSLPLVAAAIAMAWAAGRIVLNGHRIVSVADTNIPTNLPSFLIFKSMTVQILVQ